VLLGCDMRKILSIEHAILWRRVMRKLGMTLVMVLAVCIMHGPDLRLGAMLVRRRSVRGGDML